MKKQIIKRFTVSLCMLFLLSGCGGVANPTPQATDVPQNTDTSTPTPTVSIQPTITEEATMAEYKYVVLLGVDGAGTFFREADTPYMDAIFEDGAVSYDVKTSYPTISAQCWGSMLHGVLPEFHRLSNEIVGSRRYDSQSAYPSIFRLLHEADATAKTASFCNWDPINYGIIEDGLGVTMGSGNDPAVCDQILAYLDQNTPTLLFAQFDSVDGAGHANGYGTKGHLDAITAVDELIGKIYAKLEEKGILEETLFIVTADHGGTPAGSHGGDTHAERYVFLGVTGKTVEAGEISEAEVRDIPAIAAYALGLDIPASWTGRLPAGIFAGVGGGEHEEPEIPVSENRKHQNVDTPALKELKAVLSHHDVLAYLPFDGDCDTYLGGALTEKHGKLYYSEGYFGEGISLDDGYVTLEDVSVGEESFTAAFWMKTNGVSGGNDPVVFSNKNWALGTNNGFVLSLRQGDIKFNAGNSKNGQRMDPTVVLPADYTEGWMHVLLSVDRDADTVCLYLDFQLEICTEIPAALQDISFDALSFNIGQDGTGTYGCHLPAQLDEFILTADAFDEDDVLALRDYYKQ